MNCKYSDACICWCTYNFLVILKPFPVKTGAFSYLTGIVHHCETKNQYHQLYNNNKYNKIIHLWFPNIRI